MKYYVLIYDQRDGDLQIEAFPEGAGDAALARRFELERQEREHPEKEVVMLGADSEADLRRTHARYFDSVEKLAAAS